MTPAPAAAAVRVTGHERALLCLLSEGHTAGTAARELGLSERTLRRRMRGICVRLRVSTPIEAIVWAARTGLI